MKTEKILKIVGLLPIGFLALVSLVFGIGESIGGEAGGWMHLVALVFMIAAIWLCWKFPLWGGILLLGWALFRALTFIPELFLRPAGQVMNSSIIWLFLIPAISGALFLAAGILERRAMSASRH